MNGGHHGCGVGLVGNKRIGKREQMYRMCDLTKAVADGTMWIQNTWIRSEIAIVGAVLKKLRDADSGVIREGWTVASVSSEERPESYLIARVHVYDDLSKKCDQ